MSDEDLISSADKNLSDEGMDDSGIPVLPLRDVVVYPHMVIPLFVGREKSIVALERAMHAGKRILLIAQRKADLDDPQPEDLYEVGTLATILQLLKLPDSTVKVLVEGGERVYRTRIPRRRVARRCAESHGPQDRRSWPAYDSGERAARHDVRPAIVHQCEESGR